MSIQIENLYHAYNRKAAPAVDGLSITIETGDLYILLGPSGYGETICTSILISGDCPTSNKVSAPVVDRKAICEP